MNHDNKVLINFDEFHVWTQILVHYDYAFKDEFNTLNFFIKSDSDIESLICIIISYLCDSHW